MTFSFLPRLPDGLPPPVVIPEQGFFPFSTYLLVQKDRETLAFEIKYSQHSGPFSEAAVVDDLLAVGLHGHFYLYSLRSAENLLALKMEGYFGHFYSDQNLFFITDACGLHCVTNEGIAVWYNNGLGIDGVVIEKITEDEICGCGDWDPPGGWQDFVLDKKTGRKIT